MSEEFLEESLFLSIFLESEDLEDAEHTDHDESIFIAMMTVHEGRDVATEVHDPDEQKEYRDHEGSTIRTRPFRESGVIRLEIFRLEDSETGDDDDEEDRENIGLRDTENGIDTECLSESLLEHLESGEEDDEEAGPLDRRIFLEHVRDPS